MREREAPPGSASLCFYYNDGGMFLNKCPTKMCLAKKKKKKKKKKERKKKKGKKKEKEVVQQCF